MLKRKEEPTHPIRVLTSRSRMLIIVVMSFILSDPFKKPFLLNHYLIDVGLYLGFTTVGWFGLGQIIKRLRVKYNTPNAQGERFILQFFITLIFIFAFSLIVSITVSIIFAKTFSFQWKDYWAHFKSLSVLIFTMSVIMEVIYSFKRWNHSHQEAEMLKGQHAIAQLETLKNQVNPHFLFNSLNTLSSIISENPILAENFVDKLSDFYRYVLDTQHKNLVPLQTEMEFARNYIFLLKIRFGMSLEVRIEEEFTTHESYLPPLVLQMLIENAIKHNIVSQSKPLIIQVSVSPYEVMVKNKIQKKINPEPSTGLGLQNINKRISFISGKSIEIQSLNEEFVVKIPLINLEKL